MTIICLCGFFWFCGSSYSGCCAATNNTENNFFHKSGCPFVWVIYMKFKIKKQEYENRTFRLPVELLEQLNKLASDKNISLNQLVVQCCEYAIDNLDDSEQ